MTRPHSDLDGYTVSYNSRNHVAIIFQKWGSVWPRVFPYCCLNVFVMLCIVFFDSFENLNLGVSDEGHVFMSLLVAFLVVSRVTISLGRYNEARASLSVLYMATRAIVQDAVLYTRDMQGVSAKKWRSDIAWKTMILLRSTMAVIDYPTDLVPPWDLPELDENERAEIKSHLYMDTGGGSSAQRWAHEQRSEWEESMRVPNSLAFDLRCAIRDSSKVLKEKLDSSGESSMLESVNTFMGGYYG